MDEPINIDLGIVRNVSIFHQKRGDRGIDMGDVLHSNCIRQYFSVGLGRIFLDNDPYMLGISLWRDKMETLAEAPTVTFEQKEVLDLTTEGKFFKPISFK